MLRHPTLDKLRELKLTGMAKALEEQLQASGPYAEMSFAGSSTVCAAPSCARRPRSRTWTSGTRGVSTSGCSAR